MIFVLFFILKIFFKSFRRYMKWLWKCIDIIELNKCKKIKDQLVVRPLLAPHIVSLSKVQQRQRDHLVQQSNFNFHQDNSGTDWQTQ